MSTLAEVRRAVRAAKRADEAQEQAQKRLHEAIRQAMDAPGITVKQLEAEVGLTKARLYQIKAGVRAQSKISGEKSSS